MQTERETKTEELVASLSVMPEYPVLLELAKEWRVNVRKGWFGKVKWEILIWELARHAINEDSE